jgi:hypothetical protein
LAQEQPNQIDRRLSPDDIFPGDELLGQIPELILELAAFFRTPAEEAIAANAVVTAKATELGQLRHAQRASVHQVLREYRAPSWPNTPRPSPSTPIDSKVFIGC